MPVPPPGPTCTDNPAPVVFTVDEIAAVSAALAAGAARTALTGPARTAVAKLFAAAMSKPDAIRSRPEPEQPPSEVADLPDRPGAAPEPVPAKGSSPIVRPHPARSPVPRVEPMQLQAMNAAPRLAKVIALPSRTAAAARPSIDSAVRSVVDEAVAARRVLRLTYLDGKDQSSEREVEPSGILAASGHWYLIGWCRARQDGRAFRLDRITAAELTAEPVRDRDMASLLGPLGRGGQTTGAVLRTR